MDIPVIRVVDVIPEARSVVVGRLYPEFETIVPEAPSWEAEDEQAEDKAVEDNAEVKVVRRGRRPTPKATKDVETK